jgi:hypothetical protein
MRSTLHLKLHLNVAASGAVEGEARVAGALLVSGNYFASLGVAPLLGHHAAVTLLGPPVHR